MVSKANFSDNVTVTVEYTQPAVYSTYTVTVVPLVPIVFFGNTSCQLTIPYNTEYNLSVEAAAPCTPNTAASIRLKYSELFFHELQRTRHFMLLQLFID